MTNTKAITLDTLIEPDSLARGLSEMYITFERSRVNKRAEWQEIQEYIFATDTGKTRNSSLPWSNKTTIPKLCQIRDNLFSNYIAALFPRRRWLTWEGSVKEAEQAGKRDAIISYMNWVIDRPEFYSEISKLIADYIDYGNCFASVEWVDQRSLDGDKEGYVGPMPKRISPLDIVFDPTANSFSASPKLIRSIVSLGELKDMIERGRAESPEELEATQSLFKKIMEDRRTIREYTGEVLSEKDSIYEVAGFTSYREYMQSPYAEILTFFGDYYDSEKDEYHRNKVIKIVDRNTVIGVWDNPSFFGRAPIYSVGWRLRPDNLWAMGPLDNLVGMQYRIDHLENMKSDVFDIIAYPPLIVRGEVQDFDWRPMERIYIGDEGDVKMLVPDTQALQADNQIALLESKMEEMAGSPREAMGFRTPGEKTMYEVQRLEAAAGRIFQNKISGFERDLLEPLLNAMLELAKRNMNATVIRIFDDQNKIALFETLTAQDITGSGRIRPIAARHFAEKAIQVQNLTNFFGSAAGMDPAIKQHFSSVELARMWEQILDLQDYGLVEPFIQISEQADGQKLQVASQEQIAQTVNTPSGINFDADEQ